MTANPTLLRRRFGVVFVATSALLLALPLGAQNPTATTLPEVVVTAREGGGNPVAQQLEQTRQEYPGAVATVTPEELDLQRSNNLSEVLARVPGAAVVDEDGRGTKPNFSLRGLNPIRSEFVQLLQDGVPLQPSLYSETAAYYGVPAERLEGIEIIKGGASILYGPNTVGGVANFITRPPTGKPFSVILDTRYDSYGDYSGNIFVNSTYNNAFAGIEYLHKGGNGFRDSLGYSINDLDLRLGYHFNEDHTAQVRFQFYDEVSETPGGLLPDQFAKDRTQSNKPNDEFFGTRIAGDLRSSHRFGDRQQLDLLFYVFNFERNWFLQEYLSNTTADTTLRDANSQFLREFTVLGFEPKYTLEYDLGPTVGHELTIGGRYYYDTVDRRAATGASGTAREGDGVLTSHDELSTTAIAGYVQNEFKITRRLSVVPGVRYEHIEQTREDALAALPEQSMDYDVWVPGIGVKFDVARETQLYANVSKSFRPPSFGDSFNPAISASSADLSPTTAWTYEGGVRANPYPWIHADVGGFYTEYSDQVVVSAGTAENFDTTSYGFEAAGQVGLMGLTHLVREGSPDHEGDHEVFLQGTATLVNSTFDGGVFAGNDLPYVPEQSYTFGVRYAYRDRFDIVFQGRYVGNRFTDSANTIEENLAGTIGELEDYVVFDLKARLRVNEYLTLNAGVNNLFDESYATQRRTSQQKGAFPGPTRSAFVAATLEF